MQSGVMLAGWEAQAVLFVVLMGGGSGRARGSEHGGEQRCGAAMAAAGRGGSTARGGEGVQCARRSSLGDKIWGAVEGRAGGARRSPREPPLAGQVPRRALLLLWRLRLRVRHLEGRPPAGGLRHGRRHGGGWGLEGGGQQGGAFGWGAPIAQRLALPQRCKAGGRRAAAGARRCYGQAPHLGTRGRSSGRGRLAGVRHVDKGCLGCEKGTERGWRRCNVGKPTNPRCALPPLLGLMHAGQLDRHSSRLQASPSMLLLPCSNP